MTEPVMETYAIDRPLGIGQVAIPVGELQRSIGFYRDVLGLRLLFQAPPGLAFLDCGGVRIMLTESKAEELAAAGVIYYRVADLDAAYLSLRARGAAFVDAPHRIARLPDHELWMAFLRDPDDHLLALMAERPHTVDESTGGPA
ncbi:MAG TPA: VOC family protein [Gemmatimonadales bacterium]|nr:VOC family protein [Gemmatimonadales bacterium]